MNIIRQSMGLSNLIFYCISFVDCMRKPKWSYILITCYRITLKDIGSMIGFYNGINYYLPSRKICLDKGIL